MKSFKLGDKVSSSLSFDFAFSQFGPKKGVLRFSKYTELKDKIRKLWADGKLNTARDIRDEIKKETGS